MIFPSAIRVLVNRFALTSALLVTFLHATLFGASNLPSAADGFDPNFSGNVFALAQQADGKLIVGGNFTLTQGNGGGQEGRLNIARINIDGLTDTSFIPNTDGQVNAVIVQADGKIIIGGAFSTVAGAARSRIARVNADGTIDASFNPNANGDVNVLALQADGKILVGGAFTTIGGASRGRVARLNTDGSVDSFNPNANNIVTAIAVQGDGRVIIGGGFTTLAPNGATATTTRNRAARLNTDGTVETTFDPSFNNLVQTIAIQLDGKILVGGNFTTTQPNGAESATARNHIARFGSDGTLDGSFDPNTDANVLSMTLQSDGKILIGGTFRTIRPLSASIVARTYLARLNVDGSVDTGFNAGPNNQVNAIIAQADGSIVFGGYFNQLLSGTTNVIATIRNRVARVNSAGLLDISFDPNARGAVLAQVVQGTQYVIGGSFSSVGGTTRNYLARINAAGTLDTSFDPNPNATVQALAIDSSGRILVGGSFTQIAGVARNFLARLNSDGTLDTGFDPHMGSNVLALAIQSDGKILVGGTFVTVQPNGATSSTARNYFARLNTDGTLDTNFNPSPNAQIATIAIQSDGKILAGGSFSAVQPNSAALQTARNSLARFNTDGTLDAAYNPNPNSTVSTMALQSDGKLIVGGSFGAFFPATDLTSTNRSRVARITTDGKVDSTFDPNFNSAVSVIQSVAVQSDQSVLIGGAFSTLLPNATGNFITRNNLVRITKDGAVDTSFDPNTNGVVRTISVLSDQRILIGGAFSSLQPNGAAAGTQRFHLARLASAGTLDSTFDPAVGGQAGGQVSAIAVQANGRFLLAGTFGDSGGSTSGNLSRFSPDSVADLAFAPESNGPINAIAVRPNSDAALTQAAGFALLNTDGSLLSSFVPGTDVSLTGQIYAVATQKDGKIIIGGAFVNNSGATGRNLLRFGADGKLDTTFNPSPDGAVYAIALQNDTSIVVGGAFVNIGGSTRSHVARLAGDGVPDTFDPSAASTVFAIAIQADEKILLGGNFNTLQPNGATSATTRNYIARVNKDGTVDTGYAPSLNAQVNAITLQTSGQALIGGNFNSVAASSTSTAVTRNYIARLNTDGGLDTAFDPNANGPVSAIVVQNDLVVMGGSFTSVGGWDTPYINRTSNNGANDASFGHRANGVVNSLALQSDGRLVVGGVFTSFDNVPRNGVARINSDNTLDTAFNPNANGGVSIVAARSDGTLLLGGAFTTLRPLGSIYAGGSFSFIGSAQVSNLALINDDGSASTNFRPNPNGAVNAVVVQADNRAIVAGAFTTIFGAARNRLVRLTSDALLDTTFNATVNDQVNAVAVQTDGKVVIGGAFTAVGGAGRNRIARVNTDGSVDAFNPNADGVINAVAVQADGKIVVGGAFGAIGGGGRNRLARLNTDGSADGFNPSVDGPVNAILVQADGKIVIGGAFQTVGGAARSNLARLNADGSVDASFDPGADGSVLSLAMGPDGKLLVGGTFTRVAGLARYRFARLAPTSLASQTITATNNMTTVLWTRGGSAPELNGATFEQSTDNLNWTLLGRASRVGTTANWQLNGVSLPSSTVFYVRARGLVASSQYGSSGLTETVRWLTPAPVVSSPTVVGGTAGSPFYYAVTSPTAASGFTATGLPPGLTIDPITGIISGTPQATGTYTVTVTATNAGGSTVTTLTITISASGGGASGSRLVSLAARGRVAADNPLIAGFVVGGSQAKSLLFRGVGPGLNTTFGLQSVLATPQLRLYDSSGQLIQTADSWGGQSSLSTIFTTVGAFPLAAGSADSAFVATLQPGVYTIQVVDPRGVGGIALVEIYDVTPTAAPKLVEISARGAVDSGDGLLIGGLVISGTASKQVLLRGAGPSLASLGVGNALADPTLTLYNSQTQIIARNDNWQTPVTVNASYPGVTGTAISAAAASSGAFPFPSGSADSAMIVTLAPGNYTVQIAGANNTSGVALVEIYELP